MKTTRCCVIIAMCLVVAVPLPLMADDLYRSIHLQGEITHVQPMTGIVMWAPSSNSDMDYIQLEFLKLGYNDVVQQKGVYDWSTVELDLKSIAGRKHQAVLRFQETEPGEKTTVPDFIKKLETYKERHEKIEDKDTYLPDWSNPEYREFFLDFYEKLAKKYDNDRRLAFLEVGFGLWAEYHINGGSEVIGETFPSLAFQAQLFNKLAGLFRQTPWAISQDAHVVGRAPFAADSNLLKLKFGIFDDSFHLAWQPGYNLAGRDFFGRMRFQNSPVGGEILFKGKGKDFAESIAKKWEQQPRSFGITFLLGDEWRLMTTMEKIRDHGLACGYKFQITSFKANSKESIVGVTNIGVAPIYYDAFMTVNGIRSQESLKGLLPGMQREFHISSGGDPSNIKLTIECDRLVSGQRIEFKAEL